MRTGNRITRRSTMNSTTILKGAFVAFCLIGMLVLPAAAAPGAQPGKMNGSVVDQELKEELWASHQQYRLSGFDTNIQRATGVITILGKYGVDTTGCQATLTTISGKRSALETALTSRDKESLRTVNEEIRTLWQQFRAGIKDALRNKYGSRAAGEATGIASQIT
jgi:hypothetical protein